MRTLDELGISPAPWDYQPNNPQGITVADRGNWTICCLPNPADARLIAAAPDCLMSLAETMTALKTRLPSTPTLDELEIINRAEAAIRKATGESEGGEAK